MRGDRVQRTIGPPRSGASHRDCTAHDLEYVRDFGVVALEVPPSINNPVDSEVVLWELTHPGRARR